MCGKQFIALRHHRVDNAQIWVAYTAGKQTYGQLAQQYGCSIKTIQRCIDSFTPSPNSTFEAVANVVMDTTYFGRFGVMVFKDSISGKCLYKQYVNNETNKGYLSGIEQIVRRGIRVQAIICDGRKGLFELFGTIPVQMCQFHQVQIINRYLTRKPKTQAAVELRALSLTLVKSDKAAFSAALVHWQHRWEDYLKERTIDAVTQKTYYTHKRLRSAWLSLKRNLPWLFVFEDYKELMIPNTTNALDGSFADLKNKLRNHSGLSIARKKKLIDGFFEA